MSKTTNINPTNNYFSPSWLYLDNDCPHPNLSTRKLIKDSNIYASEIIKKLQEIPSDVTESTENFPCSKIEYISKLLVKYCWNKEANIAQPSEAAPKIKARIVKGPANKNPDKDGSEQDINQERINYRIAYWTSMNEIAQNRNTDRWEAWFNELFPNKAKAEPSNFNFFSAEHFLHLSDSFYPKYFEIDILISTIVFLSYLCRPEKKFAVEQDGTYDRDWEFRESHFNSNVFHIPYNFNPTYKKGAHHVQIDDFAIAFLSDCIYNRPHTPWYNGRSRNTRTQYAYPTLTKTIAKSSPVKKIDFHVYNLKDYDIEDFYLYELLTGVNLSLAILSQLDKIPLSEDKYAFISQAASELPKYPNIYGRSMLLFDYFNKLHIKSYTSTVLNDGIEDIQTICSYGKYPLLQHTFINVILTSYSIKYVEDTVCDKSRTMAEQAIADLRQYLNKICAMQNFRYIFTEPYSPIQGTEVTEQFAGFFDKKYLTNKTVKDMKKERAFALIEAKVSEILSDRLMDKLLFSSVPPEGNKYGWLNNPLHF